METEDDRIDGLFRSVLSDYRVEPPPRTWKRINRQLFLKDIARLKPGVRSYRTWMALALLLFVTISLFWFISTDDQNEVTKRNVKTMVQSKANSPEADIPAQISKHAGSDALKSEILASAKPLKAFHPVDETASAEKSFSEKDLENAMELPSVSSTNVESKSRMEELSMMNSLAWTPWSYPFEKDTIIKIHTVNGTESFMLRKEGPSTRWAFSLGVIPELAVYDDSEKYTKMNYWAQTGVSYKFSRFSVSSGLGLGYMLDQGKYDVHYKSLDSVGFYTNVISYATGSSNELIFNTQTYTIYDSLNHSDDPRTTNRYTYLRIPLLVGYQLLQTQRFSISIQVGPAISFLLGKKESQPVIDYENATILRIDEKTPGRMKTNWQIWSSLPVEMFINNKFSLIIEPAFRYYLTPTAEQEYPQANPPWSVGLGVGLQFNLDPNTRKP